MLVKSKRMVSLILVAIVLFAMLPNTSQVVLAANPKAVTISKISNLKKTLTVNSEFTMPTVVNVTMSDKTKKTVPVKWNKQLTTEKKGTYKGEGTVSGYSKKVTYTLVVTEPKMGTIDILEVTDQSLSKPTDLKLTIRKDTAYSSKGPSVTIDNTIPSLVWTNNAVDADSYFICAYDQYNQPVISTYYYMGKGITDGYYDLNCDATFNISTITVTPVNSIDGSVGGGANSNDKTGETATFECKVTITRKTDKGKVFTASPSEWNKDYRNLTLSGKISPYNYFELESDYTLNNGKIKKSSGVGSFSDENGSIVLSSIDSKEYEEKYANSTAIHRLLIFTNPVVVNDMTASYIVTTSPISIKK